MENPKKLFDPYAEWFQIPTQQRPPDHYALLGLDAFEDDEQKIDAAAKQRAAYLHQLAAGPSRKEVQQLLGEIATARRTLVNPESREPYNKSLKSQSATAAPTIQLDVRNEDRGRQSRQERPKKKRGSEAWIYLLTACSVLVAIVVGTVLYQRSGTRRIAAEPYEATGPEKLQAKRKEAFDSLANVSPPRPFPMRNPDTKQSNRETKRPRNSNRAKKSSPNAISLPKGWLQDVPLLCDFSQPETSPFDEQELSAKGLVVSSERLEIPPSSGSENSVLPMTPSRNLGPRTAVSLRTKIPVRNNKIRLGMTTCGFTLALRFEKIAEKNRLTLRANDEHKLGVFEQPGAADLTLTVIRPESVLDELWWIVAFKNQVYGGRLKSERIEATNDVRFAWFNDNPTLQPPLWIDDVRFGPYAAPEPLSRTPCVVIQGKAKN